MGTRCGFTQPPEAAVAVLRLFAHFTRGMADGPYRYPDEEEHLPRLMAALVVSLLAHAAFFGVLAVGNQMGWWEAKPFSQFRKGRLTPEAVAKLQAERRQREEERRRPPELVFVQVTQPSPEPPPESEFYSSRSSRAANPEPGEAERPKIDGSQERYMRTESAPRIQAGAPNPPAEPAPAPARPSQRPPVVREVAQTEEPPRREPVEKEKPPEVAQKPPPGLGETVAPDPERKEESVPEPRLVQEPTSTAKARAGRQPLTVPVTDGPESPLDDPPTAPVRPRPKTVAEAKLRQSLLAGHKTRQEGGVRRKGPVALDVVGLEFGAYDEAMVFAVQNRWFTLLDERRFAGGATGRVVVRFRLYSDGSVRISDPQDTTVDQLLTSLCVRAIRDPSPFEKWPSDMQKMVGSDSREMRFTFFYN